MLDFLTALLGGRKSAPSRSPGDALPAGPATTPPAESAAPAAAVPDAAAAALLSAALQAEQRGDPEEAVRLYREVIGRQPELPEPYLRAGSLLTRQLHRFEAAETLLADAAARFPGHFVLQKAHAYCALAARNGLLALARYEVLCDRYPDQPDLVFARAAVLRDLKRFDEAEAVLEPALRRFPARHDLRVVAAWVAYYRKDWPEALRRWQAVIAHDPKDENAHWLTGQILAQHLRQGAEADAFLAGARESFPANPNILLLCAWRAEQRGDPEAAVQLYEQVFPLQPDQPEPYLRAGTVLIHQLRRYDAAELLLADAAARFPDHFALQKTHAYCALAARNALLALARYEVLCDHYPDQPDLVFSRAAVLRDLKRLDEAEAVLEPALRRFPGRHDLNNLFARVAWHRQDWPEALRRWQTVIGLNPKDETAYCQAGQILAQHLGQPAEAEALLARARALFPQNVEIAIEYARAASAAGDWPESLRRWQAAAAAFPDNLTVTAGRGDAEMQCHLIAADTRTDQPGAAAEPVVVARSTWLYTRAAAKPAADDRELMLRFESLGKNCEFGLVQRHFGAEPLGLLRWNSIYPADLCAGLENRFADVGQPENTRLRIVRGEYVVYDTRFSMGMHTFLRQEDVAVPEEKLLAQMCRRTRFLRDKLLDDLAGGEKIFIYGFNEPVEPAVIDRMRRAVLSYREDNLLVYVSEAGATQAPGDVVAAGPGLLLGYIDSFVTTGEWANISPTWLTVCRNVAGLIGKAGA